MSNKGITSSGPRELLVPRDHQEEADHLWVRNAVR